MAGGYFQTNDYDGLTVALAGERSMVVWSTHGIEMRVDAAVVTLSAPQARQLAELLIAAADLEEGA